MPENDHNVKLDELLADVQAYLEDHRLHGLRHAVFHARNRLARLESQIDEIRAQQSSDGVEHVAWWKRDVNERDRVLLALQNATTNRTLPSNVIDPLEDLLAMFVADWRTSIVFQLAQIDDDAARAARAVLLAESERAPRTSEDPIPGSRPVFAGDADKSGMAFACTTCSAPVGEFCDPAQHPEVPGEG